MMKTKSKAVASKKASGGVLETVKTVVYAVLIALVVRTVAYEPFNIPSGSMVPTRSVAWPSWRRRWCSRPADRQP